MIIYFSSTGNSKYVAKRIAEATKDWTRSITAFDYEDFVDVRKDGVLGIVCPTYFYGLPANVEEFLTRKKMYVDPSVYCYFVTTYGGKSGHPEVFVEKDLRARGIKLDASFSVKMPENFTPMFDVNDKAAIQKVLEEAEPVIDDTISRIKRRERGSFIESDAGTSPDEAHRKYDEMRSTSNFVVTDDCIGCMLCAKRCPSRAIEMSGGRPRWKKDKCVLCLGCIHRCPQNAVHYGESTKGRGQYKNPHDLVWES